MFVNIITDGLTPLAGSADVAADASAALAAITTSASSRLYWLLPPGIAKTLSGVVDSDGRNLYDLGPSGGTLGNIPALVTDALEDDEAVCSMPAASPPPAI